MHRRTTCQLKMSIKMRINWNRLSWPRRKEQIDLPTKRKHCRNDNWNPIKYFKLKTNFEFRRRIVNNAIVLREIWWHLQVNSYIDFRMQYEFIKTSSKSNASNAQVAKIAEQIRIDNSVCCLRYSWQYLTAVI